MLKRIIDGAIFVFMLIYLLIFMVGAFLWSIVVWVWTGGRIKPVLPRFSGRGEGLPDYE